MKRLQQWVYKAPLDVKVYIASCFMIFGIFMIPRDLEMDVIIVAYSISIFISLSISGIYMTYVGDSQYNFFRKATSRKDAIIAISLYILFICVVSYILAITEWFLFILG